jgi:hypothetical protein
VWDAVGLGEEDERDGEEGLIEMRGLKDGVGSANGCLDE